MGKRRDRPVGTTTTTFLDEELENATLLWSIIIAFRIKEIF